jgi:foldase protein PrsA
MKRFCLLLFIIALSACNTATANPVGLVQSTATLPPMRLEQSTPTGVSPTQAATGPALAARVNNQPILLDVYEKQAAQLEQALKAQGLDLSTPQGQESLHQVRQQVLNSLIDQIILEQEANKRGLTVTDAMLEAKTQESIGPDPAKFEAWLTANNLTLDEFKQTLRSQLLANQVFEQITANTPAAADQVQIRQIVVADAAVAQSLIERLKQGEDFAPLAQQFSLDESSRANGGAIDWFAAGLGLVPPEVEAAAFTLQPGQIHGPVSSALGFHIIKLENRETARPLGDKIQALKQQIFAKWLTEQRSLTTIEKFVEM